MVGRILSFLGILAFLGVSLLATALAHAQGGRCGAQPCRADVSISGHAEPQPIYVGDTSEFKFTPQNNGPDGALKIDMQATIPDGLQIVSVRNFGGFGCTTKGTFVQCDLGDFASQQQAVVRVKVKALRDGTFIAPAKVYASDVDDPNGGNGQVSATLLVQKRPGGSSGSSGSSGSGGSSNRGRSSTGGARLNVRSPQRVLKTGGVTVRVTPERNGRITVRGTVKTSIGTLNLVPVTRDGRAGRTMRVFLGTHASTRAKLRTAFRASSRLRSIVFAKTSLGTARTELQLKR